MDYKEFSSEFYRLVSESNSILIRPHRDADDDAIASSLAIYFIIKQKHPDKNIEILVTPEISNRLAYFENFEKIRVVDDIASSLAKFDLAIFLDGNFYERFTNDPEALRNFTGKSICIDHHNSAPTEFTLSLIEPKASSTAEIIYFALLEKEPSVHEALAEILLMGLIADTGRFQYVSQQQSRSFIMAKRLVEEGNIDIDVFLSEYSGFSSRIFEVVKEFMKNSRVLEVDDWPPFLASFITRDFVKSKDFTAVEVSEGKDEFTIYLKSLSDAPWGLTLYPVDDGGVKASFRSRPDGVNVRVIVEALGIGSGHDLASGSKFEAKAGQVLDTQACLDKILEWLKNNKPTSPNHH